MAIVTEREDFVEFFSPGSFYSESSVRPCRHGDITHALEMARGIKERYNASPYGFRFYTTEREMVVDGDGNKAEKSSKDINRSGMHYITGTLMRFDEIPETDETNILRSNMRCNDCPYCIENRNSWRFTGEFGVNDCIVEWDGTVSARGNDAQLVEYREKFKAERDAYYKLA